MSAPWLSVRKSEGVALTAIKLGNYTYYMQFVLALDFDELIWNPAPLTATSAKVDVAPTIAAPTVAITPNAGSAATVVARSVDDVAIGGDTPTISLTAVQEGGHVTVRARIRNPRKEAVKVEVTQHV